MESILQSEINKFPTVSFLSEIKQSVVNYEKDLHEYIKNERENAVKKMKDAQIKVQKEYSQLLEESKNPQSSSNVSFWNKFVRFQRLYSHKKLLEQPH